MGTAQSRWISESRQACIADLLEHLPATISAILFSRGQRWSARLEDHTKAETSTQRRWTRSEHRPYGSRRRTHSYDNKA